ncbi:MAG: ABC transporter substrate-binding protein [bacterium]|nr:ABC transporter substrate-binding protein [bacterium]
MKIVSLCPSLTELVYDLDRGDELVGITTYCVHPSDRVGSVEKVGGTKDPDVARIAELDADIVLLNEEENRVEDAEALAAAGVRCHSTFPRDVAGTAHMVRDIAAALERPEAGDRIAADIEERARRVQRAWAGKPAVTWAYLIWRKPYMSVNADTFVDALLALAGGRNVFAEASERYPEITVDALRDADPDLVLLGSEPFAFEGKHADELARATGLPRERFRLADGEYLSWHGSRTPDGIDYAERCLRGT